MLIKLLISFHFKKREGILRHHLSGGMIDAYSIRIKELSQII